MNHARWNVEIDGPDLLICFNDHEKSHPCEYVRYTPAKLSEITDGEIWGIAIANNLAGADVGSVLAFARAVLKEGK